MTTDAYRIVRRTACVRFVASISLAFLERLF